NITMSPDPMPTRLMMTCTVVNVERDMPSIMLKVLSKQGSDITTRGDFYRGEFALAGVILSRNWSIRCEWAGEVEGPLSARRDFVAPDQATIAPTPKKGIGVLRLRSGFATRSRRFALDDRPYDL